MLIRSLLLIALVGLSAQDLPKGPVPPPRIVKDLPAPEKQLSELSKLKAENLKLLIQLTQCQVSSVDLQSKLANKELQDKQIALDDQFRRELSCSGKFDWTTLGCANEKNPTIK